MIEFIADALAIRNDAASDSPLIPWTSPVIAFGDPQRARVATLGLNPSAREFVDAQGRELVGPERRFHSMASLGLSVWSSISDSQFFMLERSCLDYFARNPYKQWFDQLEFLLGHSSSYYATSTDVVSMCHLDLVPFASRERWGAISASLRAGLIAEYGELLLRILSWSRIETLVLNGRSVVTEFVRLSGVSLLATPRTGWALRSGARSVPGVSFSGTMRLRRGSRTVGIRILGFSHNIQSSFGVTRQVREAIRLWLETETK
jgi:hypothetical protein